MIKNITKRLEVVDINKISHFRTNPRDNDDSAKIVATSIDKFGFINPIITDENYTVLCGNTRLKALKLLGRDTAEVIVVEGLTDQDKMEFVIADNRVAEYSKWNASQINRLMRAGGG